MVFDHKSRRRSYMVAEKGWSKYLKSFEWKQLNNYLQFLSLFKLASDINHYFSLTRAQF
jgi:hypothetical protein